MSFWTQLATTVGGALGGPIGAFAGGQIASAIQKNEPVQGPLTQKQMQTRETLGALSTAVFQTYDDNKNARILTNNQNRIYATETANQNSIYQAQVASDQALANQGTDLNKLREKSEEAGFNPLTVLRSTGGIGFNNDVQLTAPSLTVPRISSPTFWSSFGTNFQNNLQNSANLENTYANTAFVTKQTAQIGKISNAAKFDPINKTIPFFITVKGEGGLKDFKIINPEIIEASFAEVGGSLSWLAAQYSSQHNVSLSKARTIVGNLLANHESFKQPITKTNLQPANVPGSFKPGPLSIDWFKNAIDRVVINTNLPNSLIGH